MGLIKSDLPRNEGSGGYLLEGMAEDPRAYLGIRLKGRYLIEDHIGSGLSAHAYRAYDTLLQGRVVVKIIKSDIAGVAIDLGEEWKAESRKAMQVRGHPHIASILDLGEEDLEIEDKSEKIHYIVTEFIDGTTLRDLAVEGSQVSPAAILEIAHQLLGTLAFLQARKLSHGDLHAGNIMVSQISADVPFIKVIDFGMASNTLIPRTREKDIHFALNQLDHLCRKNLVVEHNQLVKGVLSSFAAVLKKAQNFIPTGRMQIQDLVEEVEGLKQELARVSSSQTHPHVDSEGQRRRIEITRKTPFFGRDDELEKLYREISGAFISKKGIMQMISGEAGIGKTRLVDEALGKITADRTRHLFLYSRCKQTPNLPYANLFDAVINFLQEIPGGDDEEKLTVLLGSSHNLIRPVANLIGEYRQMVGNTAQDDTVISASANVSFLLAGFLTQTALNTPIVLFLDDLHWADDATIEFLEFLVPRIGDSPIVVFGTYRSEEVTPVCSEIPSSLSRLITRQANMGQAKTLELQRLEREDVDEILSNIYTFVHPHDFTSLTEAVRKMAGGNPFFLFEITGLMEDEGILKEKGEGNWYLKDDLKEFTVPDTINALIQRRVDRLTLNEILLLRRAALQGDSFDSAILARMFTPDDEPLEKILDSLDHTHGLINHRENTIYSFSHHQIRMAVFRSIPPDDVIRGHKDIARILRQLAVLNATAIPHHLIAHHLAQAGESRKAAENYLEVGKRSLKAQQYHLALDHLKNAADLIQPSELQSELSIDITLSLIEAVKPLGERSLHKDAILQLQAIAGHTGRKDLELRSLLEECIYLRMISNNERSLDVAAGLAEIAGQRGDQISEAIALKEAGTTSYLMGRMEAAEEYFHKAAGILASTGDRAQLARVYNNLGLVCRNTARQQEMIQYFNRALEVFRDIGDMIGQRFPLGNLGLVYFERGEYERAFECFNALKGSLGNNADLMMEAKVDFSIGEIYLEVGLFDKAREACEAALETFITIGNRQGESEVLGTLGGVHLAKGDIQISREYFEKSIEVKKAIGNTVGMMHSQITLARIANMEGRHEEGLRLAQEVLENARTRNQKSIELECLTEIMVAKAHLENPQSALKMISDDINPKSLNNGISAALITFAYKAGEIAFQAGDEEKALDYIGLSGKIVEGILESIEEPEWRDAYEKKRGRILDTYRRLKPAMTKE